MELFIDCANGTVNRDTQNGAVLATYRLETKAPFLGKLRKRPLNKLTGRIVVGFPMHNNAYQVCDDWKAVRECVKDVHDVNPEAAA